MALNRKEASQRLALLGRRARTRPYRSLFEEAIGDLSSAPSADAGDAGDGQQILNQRLGAGVIGPLQSGQDARLAFRAIAARFVEDRIEGAALREPPAQAPQQHVRQIQRMQRAIEKSGVAE